ncbi:endolytic transglycosylase MltG [Desulfurobacterium indicum]|uniref:Endolytic murein transglycosylase n=1 Tax=Desulfurobacterium indicum TaxID=1914305 RepID=A0A1R1MLH9_9BACT|nr:endolytic transglycosylase MltG [Desulfurobacterium indicum]OMH40647.1 hypothetical protein BLW93_03935 [Desulfurobacterium indicum]
MKRRFFYFVCLIIFLLLFGMVFSFETSRKMDVSFSVRKGESTYAVIDRLAKEHVIKEPFISKIYARFNNVKVKAGKYILNGTYSDEDILKILSRGQVHYVKFVIPEGYDLFDVAGVLDSHFPNCNKERFLRLAFNSTFVRFMGINSTSLEGFLFPDTYLVDREATCSEIVSGMVSNFNRKVNPLFKTYNPPALVKRALGSVSVKKLLTVASIVEKETSLEPERPIIAGIIYKRLIRKMPLQCDPTVIYAYRLKGIFKKRLNGKDIEKIKSPFNTYLVRGLPPTPICNPGIKSIRAAMYPVNTTFLYFFAVNGKHVFSKTYKEHLRKMRKYYNRHVK